LVYVNHKQFKNLQVEEKQAPSFHIYTFRSAAKIPKHSQHASMPAIP